MTTTGMNLPTSLTGSATGPPLASMTSMASTMTPFSTNGTTLPATLEPVPITPISIPTTTSAPSAPPTSGRVMSAVERYVIVIALAIAVVLAGIVLSYSSKK